MQVADIDITSVENREQNAVILRYFKLMITL